MTKQECLDAINGAPAGSPLYGARTAWPLSKYFGKCTQGICIYGDPNGASGPWVPTSDDNSANDYIKGGDKPPTR